MGMPVRVDVRDRGRGGGGGRRGVRAGCAVVDATVQPVPGRLGDPPRSTAASWRCATRIPTCARCSRAASGCARATGGYFDARAAGRAGPVRPRQGLGGRPRGRAAGGGGRAALLHRRGRRRAAARRAVARRGAAPAAARPARRGARAARRRGGDLGRLRARRPRRSTRWAAAPARGALSVTVVGRDLATADAYATAAFAMGGRGPAWTARLRGCEAMTVLDGRARALHRGLRAPPGAVGLSGAAAL